MTPFTLPEVTPLPQIDRTKPPPVVRPQVDEYFGVKLPVYTGQLNTLAAAIADIANGVTDLHGQALGYRNEANHLANTVAAGHAAAAAISAGTADTARGLAAAEHAGATAERELSQQARDAAQTFANAAGQALGLPESLASKPLAALRINADGDGVEATYGAPAGDMQRKALTAATTLQSTDKGALIDCSGTWTLAFAAAAALGAGWWCYVRNTGTGTITADPSGAELIDGVASGPIRPGMTLLIQCDGAAFHCLRVVPHVAMEKLTSGTSWTCPLGVRAVRVSATNGGQPGLAGNGTIPGPGGVGGSTGLSLCAVTPGATYTYAVGASGGTTSISLGGVTVTGSSATVVVPGGYGISSGGYAFGYAPGGRTITGFGFGGDGFTSTTAGNNGSPGGIILEY